MNFSGRKIEASNLPNLDGFEKSRIEASLCSSFDKLCKVLNNEILLHAHFKRHEEGGRRAKHSVHLKLSLSGNTFVASEAGWDPLSVTQKALKVLERAAIKSVKRR